MFGVPTLDPLSPLSWVGRCPLSLVKDGCHVLPLFSSVVWARASVCCPVEWGQGDQSN